MTIVQAEQEARIELKINGDEKQALEEAAFALGLSLDDFVTSALRRTVDDMREHGHLTVLSARDFARFQEIVDSDAKPNEALKAAAADYSRRLADGSLQTC